MMFVKPVTVSKTFFQSLFSIASAFGASTVHVRLKEDNSNLYEVFIVDPVFGNESVIGRIPGKTFFTELRHAGVKLKSGKPISHLRFRTDWLQGKRYQARVSYIPSTAKERRKGVLGTVTFDAMKTYQLEKPSINNNNLVFNTM